MWVVIYSKENKRGLFVAETVFKDLEKAREQKDYLKRVEKDAWMAWVDDPRQK